MGESGLSGHDLLMRAAGMAGPIKSPNIKMETVHCITDRNQAEVIERLADYKWSIQSRMSRLESKDGYTEDELEELHRLDELIGFTIQAEQMASSDLCLFKYYSDQNNIMSAIREVLGSTLPEECGWSSKTTETVDLVKGIIRNDNKVIIFTETYKSAKLLLSAFSGSPEVNPKCCTEQMDDQLIQDTVDLFNTTDECNVLICTDTIVSKLNVQGVQYVINYEQPDRRALKTKRIDCVQCADSEHNVIYVYDLISTISGNEGITRDEERLACGEDF